jgi:hypothetical protein
MSGKINNVISLAKQQPPVRYSVHIDHFWNGEIGISVEGISADPTIESKNAVLSGLREAVSIISESVNLASADDSQLEQEPK